MLIYLLVVTLTALPGSVDWSDTGHPLITNTVVTHSFAVAYPDRVAADLAIQRIRTRWAKALQVSVTAEVYEVCVSIRDTLPCAGAGRWIRVAPPLGASP